MSEPSPATKAVLPMDLPDLEKRAAQAVAQMSDAAVRRIASADADGVVIALASSETPNEETVSRLRSLVHQLCKERAERGRTSLAG